MERSTTRAIQLRGVEVHNLRRIDVDIPHHQLVVLCGVSGSGKSSLALDTLYAEGQRRYIETFSAYTRQFLERWDKPNAERIDHIPPAIAVAGSSSVRSVRSTVATTTEIADYLRLLFAKVGQTYCTNCQRPIRRDNADSMGDWLTRRPERTRLMICIEQVVETDFEATAAALREQGLARIVARERLLDLQQAWPAEIERPLAGERLLVVLDRLSSGGAIARLRDSLETAFHLGHGTCFVLLEQDTPDAAREGERATTISIEGRTWLCRGFSRELRCVDCRLDYLELEPRLFSFNSPLGACAACEGDGVTSRIDPDLVIENPHKSLRDGAILPWSNPPHASHYRRLLEVAEQLQLRLDVPYGHLTAAERATVWRGDPSVEFVGLELFFESLAARQEEKGVRAFLQRWRGEQTCLACHGARLRPVSLATRYKDLNIAQVQDLTVREAARFFAWQHADASVSSAATSILSQIRARLGYLETVGLGYLTLGRTLRTLSAGEARRVSLTSALGATLVNMLYVLDEPTRGLHPSDTDRLVQAILGLRDRKNTMVVVEHDEALIRAADQIIEIGPGAGQRGGQLVFQGTPRELAETGTSLTADYLSGRRAVRVPARRREPKHGWIRLVGARGNNLQNQTVEFPLGLLCVVTGVSGAGKSTLVQETLFPALCARLRKAGPKPAPHDDVFGAGQIDDCVLVDQSPVGRSPRSNPVTYMKAFDEIRTTFAETIDARTRNFHASHFSFNVEGGRCTTCEGDGFLAIDMQFLADVYMRCAQCHGKRYRPEILEVTYRGRNIADVLEMTVREAFAFFRGQNKVQNRLKKLIDVGLDYVRLGQPANTLSAGEAQRLKLGAYLATARRGRCLFLLEEPTSGLHSADIVQLLDCFEALLAVGHSLIVVEHNPHLIKTADYVIDLGPGAASEGGRVVVAGTPEQVARDEQSVTGRHLARVLSEDVHEPSA